MHTGQTYGMDTGKGIPTYLVVQIPLSCDLGQVVKQLAHLGCYDGLLDLPLRRAAAVDPERAARLPGEAGRAAREVGLIDLCMLHFSSKIF